MKLFIHQFPRNFVCVNTTFSFLSIQTNCQKLCKLDFMVSWIGCVLWTLGNIYNFTIISSKFQICHILFYLFILLVFCTITTCLIFFIWCYYINEWCTYNVSLFCNSMRFYFDFFLFFYWEIWKLPSII